MWESSTLSTSAQVRIFSVSLRTMGSYFSFMSPNGPIPVTPTLLQRLVLGSKLIEVSYLRDKTAQKIILEVKYYLT